MARTHAKVALVLSAGGMFGAYQAGVWEVLADVFRPDLVVGTSIGSLNGWLIAGGVSPTHLVERWLSLDEFAKLKFRFPRRWTDGIVETRIIETWVRGMAAFTQPRMPYGLVATHLRTLKPQLFQYPPIEWQHLMASCAIPGLFGLQLLNNALYCDGGILQPLPLWAAAEMGAAVAVSTNVMAFRPALVKAVSHLGCKYPNLAPQAPESFGVIEINPSEPLGSPRDSIYWTRANAERWIRLGRRDALHAKQSVVKCVESVAS